MAKNRKTQAAQREAYREAKKARQEAAIENRDAEGRRLFNLSMMGLGGLIAAVLLAAIVMELIVRPNQAAAVVNGEEISISEWQDFTRLSRGNLVMGIEDMKEFTGDNIAQLQQFAGQQLVLLQNGGEDQLGDLALDQLINNTLMEQEAEERGITISEADIDAAIKERFNFYDGGLPTATPEADPTIVPTPTITPIAQNGDVAEAVPTTEPLPTPEPQPTQTPVSQESYDEQFGDELSAFTALGLTEAQYRQSVRYDLIRQRLIEEFEADVDVSAPHASAYIIRVQDEAEADELVERLGASDSFLTVWNETRSFEPDLTAESNPTAFAYEFIWRTQSQFESGLSEEIAANLFALAPGEQLIKQEVAGATEDDPSIFYFVSLSGLEDRDLPEATVRQQASSDLQGYLEGLAGGEEVDTFTNRLEGRAPGSPDAPEEYYEPQPTPTPFPTIAVTVAPPDVEGEEAAE